MTFSDRHGVRTRIGLRTPSGQRRRFFWHLFTLVANGTITVKSGSDEFKSWRL